MLMITFINLIQIFRMFMEFNRFGATVPNFHNILFFSHAQLMIDIIGNGPGVW